MGHTDVGGTIRPVNFDPPSPEIGDIELTTLERMRVRGGPSEFLTPQRLDFDMLLRIDRGQAVHTVDFTSHHLGPGDVLWVRAGQVHQWGEIANIDGPVALFAPHVVDDRTRGLVKAAGACTPNHWPAASVQQNPTGEAWALLEASGSPPTAGGRSDLHAAVLAHSVSALLIQLALVQPIDSSPGPTPTHPAYVWFRDEIDRQFHTWHQVAEYAGRIGYSPRTLNRLARESTGLSAKQLIDERIILETKRLLSHADASVAEIATQLGFEDASNFSTYFRRRAGLTPGAFRTRARASPPV